MVAEGATRRLATFVANLHEAALPEPVRAQALAVIGDAACVSLAGAHLTPEVAGPIREATRSLWGAAEATLWLTGERVPAAVAALVNGTSGHTIDIDDTHLASIAHLGVPVLAAALAVAEREDATAADLITAVVAGFEVGGVVGRTAVPGHYRRWHSSGTIGGIAAAAAAAKLLRLDAQGVDRAIGFAADDSGGTRYGILAGDYTKSLHIGTAAWKGVFAALLAAAGAAGPEGILEHDVGWYFTYTEERNAGRLLPLLDRLGDPFQIMEDDFKAYPCMHSIHTAIEATETLVRAHELVPDDIAEVIVRQPVYTNPGLIYEPRTIMAARMSTPYGVAWAALTGRLQLEHYTNASLSDPRLRDMIGRVRVVNDEALNPYYPPAPISDVEIRTIDGRTLAERQLHPKGSHLRPFAPGEHREKMRELAAIALGPAAAATLVEFVLGLRGPEPARALAGKMRAVDSGRTARGREV